MQKPEDIKGIITVLNTPFTEGDRIDLPSLRRNVGNALDAGVVGFLVPAMASEVEKLSSSEREEMVSAVLDEVDGAVPVIGGASAATQETRVEATKNLIEMGCPGVLVRVPYEGEGGYESQVREIAELEPGFLMLQDWDSEGGGVPVSLVAKLFEEVEPFKCLKVEVVPAGVKYSRVLQATGGRLHVSGGWAVTQMIEALDRGVDAFMPTGMHRIYTEIYSLYRQESREQAKELFHRLLPVLAFSNQHLDISIHFFKRLLFEQGVYSTARVREPILPFDDHHEKMADEMIERVKGITARVEGE